MDHKKHIKNQNFIEDKMFKVHEVCRMTGVSARTLHYYDQIELLHPAMITEAGYRIYGHKEMEKLRHILLFRELQFSLKEIKEILNRPNFDSKEVLEQQIKLLEIQKEHLENLITYARGVKTIGVDNMDFSVFDKKKMEEYTNEAKKAWGKTDAWKEFEEKSKDRTSDTEKNLGVGLMSVFVEFGQMMHLKPSDADVQAQVKKLQDYISEHYYTCTKQILSGLGQMYVAGGSMTENIENAGGKGVTKFVSEAIKVYCGK